MSLSKNKLGKILITSAILLSYLGGALHSSGEALYDQISTSDIGRVAIEQSVQQKESSTFLSSLFAIPTAHAGYEGDGSIYSKLSDIKGSVFEASIVKAYQKGIIKGYSDGKFYPNKSVSFIESLAILIKSGPKGVQVVNYQSPSDTHWSDAYKALYSSQDNTNVRSFKNDDSITRDFAVYLMLRQIGVTFDQSDYSKITHKFTDVKSNSKFAPYLAFANLVGISNGYDDGSFGVNKTVTRGELTTMAYRTLIDNKDSILQKYQELMGSKTTVTTPVQEVKQDVIKNEVKGYTVNEKGQKTGYEKNTSFKPSSYTEVGQIFNEKGVIDISNYKYRADGSIPTPYESISTSVDGGFSLEFYKFMEDMKSQGKDISIPLYLVPSISYNGGGDALTTNGFNINTSQLGDIDINNYPALKLLVTKANEIESVDHFTFKSTEAEKFVKDNNLNMLLSQDIYNLLTNNGINSSDYKLENGIIIYKGAPMFGGGLTASDVLSQLVKNSKDSSDTYEKGNVVNSYTRYQKGEGVRLLINIYLQKLSGYKLVKSSVW